ncbi:MAG: hypothetical protein GEU81_06075 [Nitriliruptorales bacterium]|nr:hypothetical protein [Nitriliruptorales bacterium]
MTQPTAAQDGPGGAGPPARTTLAAGALVVAVSIPYVIRGIGSILVAMNPAMDLGDRQTLVALGIPARGAEASTVATFGAVMTLLLAVLALILAAGILRRRQWAREGAIALFGLFSIVLILLSIQGLASVPRGPNAGWGMVSGVANAVIVALLLRPSTAADMERAEMARQRGPHPS